MYPSKLTNVSLICCQEASFMDLRADGNVPEGHGEEREGDMVNQGALANFSKSSSESHINFSLPPSLPRNLIDAAVEANKYLFQ